MLEKQTKPPARYSEASLLRDMETAGKQIEDEEVRQAMKDAGLGTPATRAETIEKLLRVGYIERLGRSLRATAKGRQAIGLLHDHAITSAELTGKWEQRLSAIERGEEPRDRFMDDIRKFTTEVVDYFRNLTAEEVRAQRAEIGPCPNGDGVIRENRAAYGCSSWQSKEEPGCGFVIWKQQKGRSISPAEARDLLEDGQTDLLDGFKTRPSRARLVLTEGNQVQLIADDGTRLDAPAGPRETIAICPKCGGEIRENSRAYGCSSWKSRKEPGCGFVIWKSTKGRAITADEARQVIEQGASDWMDFKDRKGPFRGRLVLTPEKTVEVQREDETGRDPGRLTPSAPAAARVPVVGHRAGRAQDVEDGQAGEDDGQRRGEDQQRDDDHTARDQPDQERHRDERSADAEADRAEQERRRAGRGFGRSQPSAGVRLAAGSPGSKLLIGGWMGCRHGRRPPCLSGMGHYQRDPRRDRNVTGPLVTFGGRRGSTR